MYVHPETLQLHLRILKQHFDIVRLDEWVSATLNGDSTPARSCAITFDDGWRDNYEYAFPLLAAEHMPATVFIVSDMIGTDRVFWPERLGHLLRAGLAQHAEQIYSLAAFRWLRELGAVLPTTAGDLDQKRLDGIIVQAKHETDRSLMGRLDEMATCLGVEEYRHDLALMDWQQIQRLHSSGLVVVGSHTRRHTRLTDAVPEDILQDEIVTSRTIIEEKTGQPAQLFCYPNGDASARARELVSEHYLAACSTLHGWHASDADRFMIRRIGIHQDIARDKVSFLARLTGWI